MIAHNDQFQLVSLKGANPSILVCVEANGGIQYQCFEIVSQVMSYRGVLLMGLSQTFSHQCRKNLVSSCEINTLDGFMNKYTCIMGKRISKQSPFSHIFNHMPVSLPTIMSLYFNIKEMCFCGFPPLFFWCSFHLQIADKGNLQYCLGRR